MRRATAGLAGAAGSVGVGAARGASVGLRSAMASAGCGTGAGGVRQALAWACTRAAASAGPSVATSSRPGMRNTEPLLRRLMLSLSNASGLARNRASIIWLVVRAWSGLTDSAIDHRVLPFSTGPYWSGRAGAGTGAGGAGRGVARTGAGTGVGAGGREATGCGGGAGKGGGGSATGSGVGATLTGSGSAAAIVCAGSGAG